MTQTDFFSAPRRQQVIIVVFEECHHKQEMPNYPNAAPTRGDRRWCYLCATERIVKAVRYEVRE